MSSEIANAKKNLESALQGFVEAQYGKDHWMGDYVLSIQVLDMSEGNDGSRNNHYIHDGRGPFHSMRGLTEEQADWLIDMKEEDSHAARNED